MAAAAAAPAVSRRRNAAADKVSKTAGGSAGALTKLPTDTPPFTIATLKAAIPAHCFRRSTARSMAYLLTDLAISAALLYATTFIAHLPPVFAYVLWPLYWVAQGCVLTGVWVIAHEAGHRAFSDSVLVCDIVGWMFHSLLLVPYHSWRISHAKHHRSTNDMDNDEVFIPYTRSECGLPPLPEGADAATADSCDEHDEHDHHIGPLMTLKYLVDVARMLLFGWPFYLLTHITGKKYGSRTNHFEPWSPLFNDRQRLQVAVSDVGLLLVIGGLAYLGWLHGGLWVVQIYVVPYLIVNMWLVLITDLQHTDPKLPHYRGRDWTWLKGALCTLDRDYGFLNHVFHHIGDTHVAHHLFSTMPHYHAQEATAAIKPILGRYYIQDDVSPGLRGIAEALWKTTRFCHFVEDSGSVLWFKHV